jgi:hypothetical protein
MYMEEFRFILGRRVLIVLLSLVVLMGALVAMPAAGRALAARPSPVDQEASAASADPVAGEALIFTPSNTSLVPEESGDTINGGHPIIVNSTLSTLVQEWHTFYGSEAEDRAYSVTTDSSGYIYAVGRSFNTWNGPGTATPLHAHSNPGEAGDFFVLKLALDGSYIWHTFYGGKYGPDYAYSVVTDTDNNVYITGFSNQSWNGPEDQGPEHAFSGDYKDVFVLKLDSAGVYQWHTFYGSTEYEDEGHGISLDGERNVYVAVKSYDTWNGPGTATPLHDYSEGANAGSQTDVAVLKLTRDGAYVWHTFYGSTEFKSEDNPGEEPTSIAVDSSSNVYVGGFCIGSWNGPGTATPLHDYSGGNSDAFVLKLDSAGAYQWHTLYGSNENDWANGIDIINGNVGVAGFSGASWNGPMGQSPRHTYSGDHDIMILMLDSAGAYQWHTFYGSDSAKDYGLALAHDNDSVIHITGRSYAGWQGDGGVEPEHAFAGGADLYILELTSTGTYQKHTFYGSAADDWGQGIAFRASGGFYLTGYSAASWLGAGGTSPLHTYAGGHDIFVLAYPRGPNPLPGMSPWGLVVLSLSLLGLGGWCFLRRRRLA